MSEPEKSPEPDRPSEQRSEFTVVGAEVLWVGKPDTTVRPRDPNVPIFWPEDVPMPWKTKEPPPPEPPKTE
jgi:hypothetical protein